MTLTTKTVPVSVILEQTPLAHRSWVTLATGDGSGLPNNIKLGLEFGTTNPDAVKIIADFLNANLINLVVTTTEGTLDDPVTLAAQGPASGA